MGSVASVPSVATVPSVASVASVGATPSVGSVATTASLSSVGWAGSVASPSVGTSSDGAGSVGRSLPSVAARSVGSTSAGAPVPLQAESRPTRETARGKTRRTALQSTADATAPGTSGRLAGMSIEHTDVLVLGAGLSGLAAARRLAAAGTRVDVVEARARVGGRTHTTELHGTTVDVGGQWIGPGQPRMQALVEELGIQTFPTPTGAATCSTSRGSCTPTRGPSRGSARCACCGSSGACGRWTVSSPRSTRPPPGIIPTPPASTPPR